MNVQDKLQAGLPVSTRDIGPTSLYDVTPSSAHAGINNARIAAEVNRITRRTDAVVQRTHDYLDAMEERKRERRRTGR